MARWVDPAITGLPGGHLFSDVGGLVIYFTSGSSADSGTVSARWRLVGRRARRNVGFVCPTRVLVGQEDLDSPGASKG